MILERPQKILFYGDSNTYGYDPADLLDNRYPAEKRWTTILQKKLGKAWLVKEYGLNGRKIPELKYDAHRINVLISGLEPGDLFAVMLGTNDILLTMEPDAETAIHKMQLFLDFLTQKMDPSDILLIAPPNIGNAKIIHPLYGKYLEESVKMNMGFQKLANIYQIMFADAAKWEIDLTGDLVHFSEKGHRTFAEKLNEFLINETRKNA